jgi:septal ring factor EnvC (AmiA/AmiB activator)
MTEGGWVGIIIGLVAAAGGALAAFLSARAQRTAAIIEAYDEFVTHLRDHVAQLEARIERLEATIERWQVAARDAQTETLEVRRLLDVANDVAAALRAELARTLADLAKANDLVEAMREHLGLDDGLRHPSWGRRRTDAILAEVLAPEDPDDDTVTS